jgi:bifunctional ADP-heptose synthase (sugar kinase/adenylyltransferase)
VRDAQQKIGALASLTARLSDARRQGKRIAFAASSFDLLDPAHVRFLSACRGEADVLVVAIPVGLGKKSRAGPTVPVLPPESRAVLVAATRAVDHAIVLDGDDASAVIQALSPDIVCASADAPLAGSEHEAARACGARIVTIDTAAAGSARPGDAR